MIYHPTLLSALVIDILSMPIFLCLTKLVLCQNSDEIDENTDQSMKIPINQLTRLLPLTSMMIVTYHSKSYTLLLSC